MGGRSFTKNPLSRRAVLAGMAAVPLAATVPARARPVERACVLIGDWGRRGHHRQRAVAEAMGVTAERIGSACTISLGDNFYNDGVSSVDDPQWHESFESIYTAPSLQTPWRAVLGNHDYKGNVEAQLLYGAQSGRWTMPARYYRIRDVLPDGTVIDSFHLDTCPFVRKYRNSSVRIAGQDVEAQLRWLAQGLSTSDAAWKIVFGHHPIHTGDGAHETRELIAAVEPLLRQNRVAMYVSGHKHNFQYRTVEGVDYIVNGAGSRRDPAHTALDGAFALGGENGFMTMRISREAARFGFIASDGRELFSRAVPRPA